MANYGLSQRAAAQDHETLTEFISNSTMLRIQNLQLMEKPMDPMAVVEKVYLEPNHPEKDSGGARRRSPKSTPWRPKGRWTVP